MSGKRALTPPFNNPRFKWSGVVVDGNNPKCRHKWVNHYYVMGCVNVLDCVKCGAERWPKHVADLDIK